MEQIQLVGISPQQFGDYISDLFKRQLDEFKKVFPNSQETSEYMTREEVATMLKINLSTLYQWTKKGKLISYGIGKRVYYKRSELEKSIVKLT